MMKKVYICAPPGANEKENFDKMKRYTRYALLCGAAPIGPCFYSLCLDENNRKEKEIGMYAGLGLLWFCDELWLFGDEVTPQMQAELNFCKNLNIRVTHISENNLNNVSGGKCI